MLRVRTSPLDRAHVSATTAAALLDIHPKLVAKLVSAGILKMSPAAISRAAVESLAAVPSLVVTTGQVAVLRLDGSSDPATGVHLAMDDGELRRACMGPWRADPQRLLGSDLLVATVATFPVAIFTGLSVARSIGRGTAMRQLLDADLAWRRPGPATSDMGRDPGGVVGTVSAARLIAWSRGPLAYLSAEQDGDEEPAED